MLLIPYFNSCVSSSVQPRSGPHMTKSRNTARCSVSPQSRRLRCVPHTPRTLSKTPRTLVCTLLRFASSGRLDRRHPRCPLGCERFPCLLFNLRALFKREKKRKKRKERRVSFSLKAGFFGIPERERKTETIFGKREEDHDGAVSLFSRRTQTSDERNRAPPPFLCSNSLSLSLSLSLQRRRLLRDDPHKKKQADQEVMTQKRKGQNAKRELLFF